MSEFERAKTTDCRRTELADTRPSRSKTPIKTPNGVSASFARYSSDQQREESIQDQQRKCREAAAANGHFIEPELEFYDQAVSGTKLHRDGLDRMLGAAEAGRFAALYFHSVSRLARESVITMPMLKRLVHVLKVRVLAITDGIDSARDGWDLAATLCSVMSERYIGELSANVLRGQEGTVLAGYSVGDYCFGYKSLPVAGAEQPRRGRHAKPRMEYAIDDEAAGWVKQIFEWFVAETRSIRWITRELNRLSAPKDHRSTSKHWHHQQVADLLRNRKYVGIWPWGQKKNMRNPLTGQASQEPRSEDECEKWLRHFPDLRIVSDEMMAAAEARLAENGRRQEHRRRPTGQFAGSRTGNSATHPRHLLSGLLRCEACGATLHVSGTGGKYLCCPNWAKGTCTCKTQVRRELAERRILNKVSDCILSNTTWREAIVAAAMAAWKRQQAQCPADLQAAENAFADVERKISRLLDSIEGGNDSPDVSERLAERRKERAGLQNRLEVLRRSERQRAPAPTPEWIAEQLGRMCEVLGAGGSMAALALRRLVGGFISVREARLPSRKRGFLVGRFALSASNVSGMLHPGAEGHVAGEGEGTRNAEEIVIEFRRSTPEEEIVGTVKQLWDAGLSYRDISARVGRHRNFVRKAVTLWHDQCGLKPPDGRSCRKRLAKADMPEQLADQAKELWDRGLLMQEIAERLKCNRDTVTKSIQHWFHTRGLPIPDGRTRRKSLTRKSSNPERAELPSDKENDSGAA